ncbi:MAG TPA: FAD-binding protein [Chitinophagaceae bacterium]|nr:FAD-binding protein [Chitinophagaceae bacterium]
MAQVTTHHISNWDNYHFNGPWTTNMLLDIDCNRNITSLLNRFNDAAATIQQLLQDAVDNHERFRAFGSGWSLSNIAHQKDRMLFNRNLDIKKEITENQLNPATPYKAENLFLLQCGANVKEITEYLFRKGKSLKACGASNGQTIAGAISTGVHGAAIDWGSIQDCVVGLQLITGPGPRDILYIERESRPALNDDFARSINARPVRHDGLFNAALVSLGAFGVIHGVVIEAEDRFLLKRYVKKIKKADALQIADGLDFANARFRIDSEMAADGSVIRPYHYKLYINPYKDDEDFVTEIIYKKTYTDNYPDPVPCIQTSIFKDVPTWVACFAAKHKRIIPLILSALKQEAFPTVDQDVQGTLGEIFWDTAQSSKAFGCGVGIHTKDCSKALELFTGLMNTLGPIPGILSMRFVKGSEATLAFTKFPVTCVLEVDGIPWEANANMIGLEPFLAEVVKTFKAAGIAFTLHWGKNGPWSFPNLVDIMYGDADDEWKNMRSVLLSKQMADVFSNDFLSMVKLDDYRVNLPADLAAIRNQLAALPV